MVTKKIPTLLRLLFLRVTYVKKFASDCQLYEYEQLRHEVLVRDGWRCQSCGSGMNLHVHHQLSRGRGGADTADNLITLCADCHRHIHMR